MITATISGIGGWSRTYDDSTNPHLSFNTVSDFFYHLTRHMANETGRTYHVTVHDERGHHDSGPVYGDALWDALGHSHPWERHHHVIPERGFPPRPCTAREALDYHGKALRRQLELGKQLGGQADSRAA